MAGAARAQEVSMNETAAQARERTPDDFNTPRWLLDEVRKLGQITLDPCSNPWSTVRALVELDGSPGKDGLTADWRELAGPGGLVFVNPPYGRGCMSRWAPTIALNAAAPIETLALVKADHSTAWWDVLRGSADAVVYLADRVRFEGAKKSPKGGARWPSALFYFGARRYVFADIFDALGDVRILR